MTCSACGDKPQKAACGFPKAVVEIDNPEKIILLRKVLVPASMGDESTFPPTIGKYHNVLLEYEASGGIYLYSSDGIPTKLSSDVTELQAQLNALRVRIGEEEVARADADTALSNRITSLDDSLATVARTGSYNDLSDKPTIGNGILTIKKNGAVAGTFTANATTNKEIDISIPTRTSDLTNDGSDGTSTYIEADELSTVATTGSYNDLTNKPTIPTVNNATLTIQKNGTNVQTFTANSSTNKTANITVPTAVSELTNDASYATTTQLNTGLATKQNTLTAGDNIQINGNTISATDTTYTAGNAIDITNGEISADIHPADFFTASDSISDCGSNLSLDNTIASTPKSVELKGDTFQQTYSGKNLLRNNNGDTQTISGVTFTKNPDGTITANGTATAGINYYINGSSTRWTIPEGTYTLSTGGSNGTGSTYFVFIDGSNDVYWNSATPRLTQTVPSGGLDILPRIVVRQGQTLNNVVFKPMLEQGSTATSFEPYTSGIPAPNPDYPQDIQVVTGEQTVTVTGKNLFPMVSQTSSSTGITIARNSDGTYNISGTATSEFNAISWVEDLSAFADGQTYTLSVSEQVGDLLVLVDMYNGSTWLRSFPRPSGTTLSRTAAIDLTNATKIKFSLRVQSGKTVDLTNLAVQFEKGAATDYEPYHLQSYTINLGKNLFNKSDTSTQLPNTYINTTGVLQASTNAGTVFAKCQPNATYTVSKSLSARFIIGETATLPADGVTVSNIIRDDTATHLTITTGPTAQYIVVFCHHSSDTMTLAEIVATVQIEAGSVASQYASYFTPIELCKIDDYQDYIYKSGDDWYLHKEVEAFDLSTGTYVATTSSIRGLTNAPNIKYVPNNQTIGSAITSGYKIRQGQGLGTAGAGWFAVDTNRVNFNTGGSTDPVGILYYARETAADTQITNTVLVAQLNALAKAKSYNDQTNIIVTTAGDNLPATLCVETYRKSLSGVIEAIDNACTCGKKATHLVLSNPTTATWNETGSIAIPISDGSAVSMGTFVSTDVVFTKDDGTTMTVGDLYTALTNGKSFEIDLPFGEINSACSRDSAAIVATVENVKLDGSSKQTLDQTSQGRLSEMYTSSVPVAVHLSAPWGGVLLDERFGVEHLMTDDGDTMTSSYRFVVNTYETFQPPR